MNNTISTIINFCQEKMLKIFCFLHFLHAVCFLPLLAFCLLVLLFFIDCHLSKTQSWSLQDAMWNLGSTSETLRSLMDFSYAMSLQCSYPAPKATTRGVTSWSTGTFAVIVFYTETQVHYWIMQCSVLCTCICLSTIRLIDFTVTEKYWQRPLDCLNGLDSITTRLSHYCRMSHDQ